MLLALYSLNSVKLLISEIGIKDRQGKECEYLYNISMSESASDSKGFNAFLACDRNHELLIVRSPVFCILAPCCTVYNVFIC